MNEILLFLSKYKEGGAEKIYASDEGEVSGIQTSDAPTKYLLKKAKKDGNEIEEILCITSKDVKENGLMQFEKMIEDYCREQSFLKPQIVTIPYDYIEGKSDELSDIERLNQIYNHITKYVKARDSVYIDYTGGLRDTSFFMTVMIRYMEYIGAKCRQIVYSNNQTNKLVSVNYIYALFDVINGISEFMQSGNSTLLNRAILKSAEIGEKYPQIQQLLKSMERFTDVIALCTVDRKMDQILESLRKSIQDVQQMKSEIHSEDEIAIQMLKNLLGEIQKKLFLDSQEEKMSYLQIIRWCLENRLLQQAITFYIEKTPDIFYKTDLIHWIENDKKTMQSGSAETVKQFYDVLYDEIGKDDSFAAFVDIFNQSLENEESYKKVISEMKKENSEYEWNRIEKTLEYVEKYLQEKYARGKDCQLPVKIKDEINDKIKAKTKQKAKNDIRTNPAIQKLFYYKKKDKKETYPKKVEALEKLREREDQRYGRIHNDDLLECLEYYLTLKTIRNQINHANESEGYETVTEYLEKNKKTYSTEISVSNIYKIVTAGIDKIQSILENDEYQSGEIDQKDDELGKLDAVEYGEVLWVKVTEKKDSYVIVEDREGKQAELKSKKMTGRTRALFDANQIMEEKLQVKCINMISKRCPFVVEEQGL